MNGWMRTAIAAGLGLLVVLGAGPARVVPAGAQDLIVVRVGAPPSDDATPILYALKAGLFEKAGLDVQFTPTASGSATVQAVVGKALDIGLSSTLPLIQAHVRNIGIQLIAPDGLYIDASPYAALVARIDAPIKTGADLNGKTIGVAAIKDTGSMASLAWIEQNGGDPATVKQIEVSYSLAVAALVQGRIDADSLIQPGLAQALATGKLHIIGKSYSALAKRFLITGWFAGADYASANPGTVRRFARVMREAADYANTHHDDTVALLSAFTKVDPATIRASTRETYADALDPADVQKIIDAAAKFKAIDAGFDARDMINPVALEK